MAQLILFYHSPLYLRSLKVKMENVKKTLDEQFNKCRLHEGVEPLAGQVNNYSNKATHIHVAIDREGDIHSQANLLHFDISQAFAWEYLRKKQRATEEDLKYAQQLQEEMNNQLELERQQFNNNCSNDAELAKKLSEQLNSPPQSIESTNGLRDSAFARLLQAQEESKVSQLLSDSEFARRIANEVLSITPDNQDLRESQLQKILNEEVALIRSSQNHSLPQVLENERGLQRIRSN